MKLESQEVQITKQGVKNLSVLFVMNAGDVKDTGGSWIGFYNFIPYISHRKLQFQAL